MFYKEINFKNAEIGRIPKEWEVVKLGNVLVLKNGERPNLSEEGLFPVYGANGVMGYTKENLVDNDFTIIIGRVGASGEVHLGTGKIWVSDNAIYSEKYDKQKVYQPFIYHLLKFKQLKRFATKTTHPIITQSFLKSLKIPLPPLEEQQKIAHVLMSIDKAIEVVDEAIAKAERIKKGLMQELLTKGIGHREFKKVEFDGFKVEIPKEWEVVRLGDKRIARIRGNKSITNVENAAFIPMELIPDSSVYVRYEIRNLKEIKSSNYCEAGDLLLAKITPCFENGKQGIVPEDIPNGFAFTTTEAFPIVCEGIDRLFLFYILKHPKFRKALERSMSGTTGRQRVPKKAVENLLIPLPPLEEQQKIAEILSKWDEVIEMKKAKKDKLERMKKKVMELLLTGKVRVK